MHSLVLLLLAHPLESVVLLGIILNLVNGMLPARVRSGRLGRVLHVALDRVTILTRHDAPGTLKWPLVAGSLLRGVADTIDPPTADPRPTQMPPLPVLFVLAVGALGCASGPRSVDDALTTTVSIAEGARAGACSPLLDRWLGRPGPLTLEAPDATPRDLVAQIRSYVCSDRLQQLLDQARELLTLEPAPASPRPTPETTAPTPEMSSPASATTRPTPATSSPPSETTSPTPASPPPARVGTPPAPETTSPRPASPSPAPEMSTPASAPETP